MPFSWLPVFRLLLHLRCSMLLLFVLVPFMVPLISASSSSPCCPSPSSPSRSSSSFELPSPSSQSDQSVSTAFGVSHRDVLSRNGGHLLVPRRIPKMSKMKKRRLLLEMYRSEGIEPPREFFEKNWSNGRKRKCINGRHKRRIAMNKRWNRVQQVRRHKQNRGRAKRPLQARNGDQCPNKLDAVTEAFNRHLYLFAGEMVYEVWRDTQGLQQKRAFALSELFPNGPRRVSAALTNRKSGVTILVDYRTVYRFRWDKRYKRFYMARYSPRPLPRQIDFLPKKAFQWKGGHLILSNSQKFVSFDPFWNLVIFSSDKANEYFPNVDKRMIGVAKQGKDTYLMMTEEGKLQVYDMGKHKVNMEFPLSLRHLLACLPAHNSTVAR